uniref:Small integral membrane protein 33 n=1 Tax=Falco tinnunculus TaxID=100819 RepID=A0A8C4U903_FALTI
MVKVSGTRGHRASPPSLNVSGAPPKELMGSSHSLATAVIVVIFVLLAVFIIIAVHYGPHLRTVQITLYHEPMPQDLDNGVHLMDWKKLGSQKKLPAQPCQQELASVDVAGVSCQCSCKHHLPCRSTEPNVIEVTYL